MATDTRPTLHPGAVSSESTARQLHIDEQAAPHYPETRKHEEPPTESVRFEVVPPPAQPSLFRPADLGARPASLRLESRDASQGLLVPAKRRPARKRRKSDSLPFEQGTLEFLTPTAAPARQLPTNVEASVTCDQQVAIPAHRCLAGFVDCSAIIIGGAVLFGVFAGGLHLLGSQLNFASTAVQIALGLTLLAFGIAYQVSFALLGTDTPGAKFAGLRLMSFDGGTPSTIQRCMRVVAGVVSLSAGGAGFLWALLDEETLGWHDHISRTFPAAIRQAESSFRRM